VLIRSPFYPDAKRITEEFLGFLPRVAMKTIFNMRANIMAHWHTQVSDDTSFPEMNYYADLVASEIQKQKEQLAKQQGKS
jgi:hypothetical protein